MQNTITPAHQSFMESEFKRLSALIFEEPENVRPFFVVNEVMEKTIQITSGKQEVVLQARSNGELTAALYCFFEHCGIHFGFSEELVTRREKLESPPLLDLELIPSMLRRGIRMHLNFVQDQSFFTEAEFTSYIDRIASMKWNFLLFHMYNNQEWYPFSYRGMRHLTQKLGNLDNQPLPDDMIGRERIRTKRIWYPAEFESIEDPEALLIAVHGRYLRMMERAKARGMTIAASIEPEDISEVFEQTILAWSNEEQKREKSNNLSSDWQQGWSGKKTAEVDTLNPIMLDLAVERCMQLYAAYPCLDELHLISREGTSYLAKSESAYLSELNRLSDSLGVLFSDDFILQLRQINTDDAAINPKAYPYWTVLPGENQFATFIGALRYLEFASKILNDERMQVLAKKVTLVVSLYSPNPNTIRLVNQYAGEIIPAGVRFDILGDYGARDISTQLDEWTALLAKKANVGVISWLEFDGNMDLAQNWTRGIFDNISKAAQKNIDTIYFNHWRVRGLEQNAKIAAQTCFDVQSGYDTIMNRYAADVFGKDCAPLMRKAAELLELATELCKQKLYNIGFTGDWVYRYATDPPGYREEDLQLVRGLFDEAESAYLALAASCETKGQREAVYLAMQCSISGAHLNMVSTLQRVKHEMIRLNIWQQEAGEESLPDEKTLETLLAQGKKALLYAETYQRSYAKFVETCDEQGELAHYQLGVIQPLEQLVSRLKAMRDIRARKE